MDALNQEATEMGLQLINGNRREVREFIASHDTPTLLTLAILRHLGSMTFETHGGFSAYLDAIVNLQSLLEMQDV
jgi:hypothetical protein